MSGMGTSEPQQGDERERIEAVFFDVGETIVDESRQWWAWADWLGVPRHTFSAVLGAVIAAGRDHREVFECFRPGFDLATERRARAEAGESEHYGPEDLYADARPCLTTLKEMGLRVGVSGNQPRALESAVRALGLPVDVVGSSAPWGVEKPSLDFFARLVEEAGCPPTAVLHVGDRLDNDIRPAQEAGLATCLVRRGPWGRILRDAEAESRCLFRVDDLGLLPGLLRRHNDAS
jgi:HAD superfamily hydrolase (TIGR01549 family)